MRFRILGPLEVSSPDGTPVAVGGPRPRALLVLLLVHAGRPVSVERLIVAQYGDDPPAGAANAVQAQVSRLRRSLGADLIELDAGGYRLAVAPEDVDLHQFEQWARDGRRLLAADDHGRAATILRDALGLWRGTALVDLPHADTTRWDELRLAATEDLVEAELALPDGAQIAELRALVTAHPLRERLRGQLMRALTAAGRQAEALAEYEDVRGLLAGELGADPSPELAAVHLAILRAEQPVRRGVPATLTGFVGRGAELERLDLLRGNRLVTILGPGGTGKTRLAVEWVRRRDRTACFVDLSTVHGQVPQAVLAALGVRESGFQATSTNPVQRLVAALDAETLVLDNCEHLIDDVAPLVRTLLADCPDLTVLATSRAPLGLTGETLLPLAPLDVDGDSVRLFAERAAAVRPGFAVTDDNRATVAEICAALDGLPLAIELAAARLRQFGVAEISTRLAEHGRFRLLSRGDRTAAERHRTLRAVVEWSWELLTPAEQLLARRFAVFTGGAPLAAVEAVCGVKDADDLLADLVDQSLVATDGTRYRMLETIRLHCLQQLPPDEQQSLYRAHARYHLDLARRADPHLRRAEQLDWLATLSAEHGNLMAALDWSVTGDHATGAELVAALAAYWWLSGRRSQAGPAAAALLDDVPAGLDEEYVACVVHAVPRAAAEHWERADRIIKAARGPLRYPFGLALWAMTVGPPDDAAEAGWLLAADPWNVALERLGVGLIAVLGGRTADGERELEAVLAAFRGAGERWGIAQALDGLALVAGWRGEWRRAHDLWTEALALEERLGALEECADLLVHRASALVRQGEPDAAAADYRRAAELSAKAGLAATPEIDLGLAEIARLRGDHAEAAELVGRTLAGTDAVDYTSVSTRSHACTASGRLAEAGAEPSLDWHREAVTVARKSFVAPDLAAAVEGLAGAVSGERAALLLGIAVALRGTAVAGDPDVATTAARAGELIGPGAFADAYARGVAMSRDEALTALDGIEG